MKHINLLIYCALKSRISSSWATTFVCSSCCCCGFFVWFNRMKEDAPCANPFASLTASIKRHFVFFYSIFAIYFSLLNDFFLSYRIFLPLFCCFIRSSCLHLYRFNLNSIVIIREYQPYLRCTYALASKFMILSLDFLSSIYEANKHNARFTLGEWKLEKEEEANKNNTMKKNNVELVTWTAYILQIKWMIRAKMEAKQSSSSRLFAIQFTWLSFRPKLSRVNSIERVDILARLIFNTDFNIRSCRFKAQPSTYTHTQQHRHQHQHLLVFFFFRSLTYRQHLLNFRPESYWKNNKTHFTWIYNFCTFIESYQAQKTLKVTLFLRYRRFSLYLSVSFGVMKPQTSNYSNDV